MDNAPVFYTTVQEEEIQQFIKDQWGEEDNGFICHETKSKYVHTDVLAIGGEDEGKVFVTIGTGAREMNSPIPSYNRIELVMYASSALKTRVNGADVSHYLTVAAELQSLSKYCFENDTWLGPGHTIEVSDRFSKKFGYQSLLFVENNETASLSEIGEIHFLIAIPVYAEERDWMASNDNGSQRFLDAFFEELDRCEDSDDMLMIDIPRRVIIPPQD